MLINSILKLGSGEDIFKSYMEEKSLMFHIGFKNYLKENEIKKIEKKIKEFFKKLPDDFFKENPIYEIELDEEIINILIKFFLKNIYVYKLKNIIENLFSVSLDDLIKVNTKYFNLSIKIKELETKLRYDKNKNIRVLKNNNIFQKIILRFKNRKDIKYNFISNIYYIKKIKLY